MSEEESMVQIFAESDKDLEAAYDGFYDVELRQEQANECGKWRTWARMRGYTPEMVEAELIRREII